MKIAVLILLALPAAAPVALAEGDATLWYRQPADGWAEALPVGNGRLGAMVFGGVAEERIRLNGETGRAGAFGDLRLRFADAAAPDRYRRELDLAAGIVRVRYRQHGVNHRREIFASAPHRLLIVHLTADRRARVSVSIGMTGPADAVSRTSGPDGVALTGPGFHVLARAFATGGRVRSEARNLVIDEADSVTLLLAANPDPRFAEWEIFEAPKVYSALRNAHLWEHVRRFRRVELRLEAAAGEPLPTDERLAQVRAGQSDPGLAALYFQFGRYLGQRAEGLRAPLGGVEPSLAAYAGIPEMLFQSRMDELEFLPALPKDWAAGQVRGLAGAGGIEVDLAWSEGRATWAALSPLATASYRLRPPQGQRIGEVQAGGRRVVARADSEGTVTVRLQGGRRYTVRFN